jgi:hypothetical protein
VRCGFSNSGVSTATLLVTSLIVVALPATAQPDGVQYEATTDGEIGHINVGTVSHEELPYVLGGGVTRAEWVSSGRRYYSVGSELYLQNQGEGGRTVEAEIVLLNGSSSSMKFDSKITVASRDISLRKGYFEMTGIHKQYTTSSVDFVETEYIPSAPNQHDYVAVRVDGNIIEESVTDLQFEEGTAAHSTQGPTDIFGQKYSEFLTYSGSTANKAQKGKPSTYKNILPKHKCPDRCRVAPYKLKIDDQVILELEEFEKGNYIGIRPEGEVDLTGVRPGKRTLKVWVTKPSLPSGYHRRIGVEIVPSQPEGFVTAPESIGTYDTLEFKAEITQEGKYRIEANGAGIDFSRKLTETENFELYPTQPGDVNIDLIAPGSFWNPLDDNKIVDTAMVQVGNQNRGEKQYPDSTVKAGFRWERYSKEPLLEHCRNNYPRTKFTGVGIGKTSMNGRKAYFDIRCSTTNGHIPYGEVKIELRDEKLDVTGTNQNLKPKTLLDEAEKPWSFQGVNGEDYTSNGKEGLKAGLDWEQLDIRQDGKWSTENVASFFPCENFCPRREAQASYTDAAVSSDGKKYALGYYYWGGVYEPFLVPFNTDNEIVDLYDDETGGTFYHEIAIGNNGEIGAIVGPEGIYNLKDGGWELMVSRGEGMSAEMTEIDIADDAPIGLIGGSNGKGWKYDGGWEKASFPTNSKINHLEITKDGGYTWMITGNNIYLGKPAKNPSSEAAQGPDAPTENSAWINYCDNNGYSIESLDQDLEVAGSCVSEEIVPAFFVEGGEGQDMEVPESLCQEVLGTGYMENQRACGTPGTA